MLKAIVLWSTVSAVLSLFLARLGNPPFAVGDFAVVLFFLIVPSLAGILWFSLRERSETIGGLVGFSGGLTLFIGFTYAAVRFGP